MGEAVNPFPAAHYWRTENAERVAKYLREYVVPELVQGGNTPKEILLAGIGTFCGYARTQGFTLQQLIDALEQQKTAMIETENQKGLKT